MNLVVPVRPVRDRDPDLDLPPHEPEDGPSGAPWPEVAADAAESPARTGSSSQRGVAATVAPRRAAGVRWPMVGLGALAVAAFWAVQAVGGDLPLLVAAAALPGVGGGLLARRQVASRNDDLGALVGGVGVASLTLTAGILAVVMAGGWSAIEVSPDEIGVALFHLGGFVAAAVLGVGLLVILPIFGCGIVVGLLGARVAIRRSGTR